MPEVVWVIDDCPLTIKLARVRLRSLGVLAYVLPSGRAAFSAWTEDVIPKPSVVLINPDMHSGDGLAACQLLRDAGCTGLVMLHVDPAAAHIASEAAGSLIDGIIVKPLTIKSIARVLDDAAARRMRRAA